MQVYVIYLCFAYLGNSFEVKTEAASNDITECPCDDKPSNGTSCFYVSGTSRQWVIPFEMDHRLPGDHLQIA